MVRLAIDRRGSGPPVLLLHGLSSSRRAWDLLVPLLTDRATTYAVDLPGHGESPWDDTITSMHPHGLAESVAEWMDGEGLDRAHIVGNSMGGWVSLELAAMGRALSVTALCPAGFWSEDFTPNTSLPQTRDLANRLAPVLPRLMASKTVRRIAFRGAVERPSNVTYHVALDAAIAQTQARGFDACMTGMTRANATCTSAISTDVPVTIVFGDRDRILPAPDFQRRTLAPAHARWEVWWRCGHAPMWDVPEACVHVVDRVLRPGS